MPRTTLDSPIHTTRSGGQPTAPVTTADRAPVVTAGDGSRPDRDRFDRGSTPAGNSADPVASETPAASGASAVRRGVVDLRAAEALSARYQDAPLGPRIGSGGQKIVYALRDEPDLVISILKPITDPKVIAEEAAMLAQVEAAGLPVAKHVCQTTHGGVPAAVMRRYAEGSKTTVRNIDGCMTTVGESRHLNQRSIDDLEQIRQTMVDRGIRISDLQFLIDHDGAVSISDPLEIKVGTPPSRTNLKTIELLIEAAHQSIARRAAAAGGGSPP